MDAYPKPDNVSEVRSGPPLRMYKELLTRWVRISTGRSYWHRPVNRGKSFVPGHLKGYYNDYSPKVSWDGPIDADGIPLNQTIGGRSFYFPLTVIQKALGHWELWLASAGESQHHCDEFVRLAVWIRKRQDANGGWSTWPDYGMRSATPYSAMTQGQAISVLVRAYSIDRDEAFLDSAAAAVALMTSDVGSGGTARLTSDGPVIEEVPLTSPRTVLNGWVNGVFGLYDFGLVRQSSDAERFLGGTLGALVKYLPRYDAGYWSFYDTHGNLASPYYHQRHIAQLSVCERTFPSYAAEFRTRRQAFERQAASRLNRVRAVAAKAYQQLRNPPDAVVK